MAAKYYYTPFQYTDANERRTWNYYAAKGARFANCTQPCDKDRMTPEELGEFLVRDGLENRKINIRLLVCYGAGPSPIDDDYQPWMQTSGGNSIAKKLALNLASRLRLSLKLQQNVPIYPRVAGYQGPTHTGSSAGTLVKPKGAKSNEKIKAKQPFVYDESGDKEPMQRYLEAFARAEKSYIIWYNEQGQITQKHGKTILVPTTGAGGNGPLSVIGDGDTLLVMAHGFWKNGGGIGPFAGPFGRANTGMEVLRTNRGQGQRDDREIIEKKW